MANPIEELEQDHWSYRIHCSFQNSFRRIKESPSLVKPIPKIALFVLETSEINAHAEKIGDGYGIMLHSALYHAVNSLFRTILAHPSTFLSVGDISLETPPSSKQNVRFDSFMKDVPAFANRKPIDKTRLVFADHLTELTMRFIVEHELAHILAGHLDYNPNLKGIVDISGEPEANEQENFGLEMHADEIAFLNCIFWIFDSVNGTEMELPKQIFIETLDAQIHDLYVATYALFQMCSHLSMSGTHPNPLHRQIRLAWMLSWICLKYKLTLVNEPFEIIGQVINVFNQYMEVVFNLDWSDRQQETDYILLNEMKTEIAMYSEMVKSLFPMLKPHSFIKLE